MALHLHRSNRSERLVDALAEIVRLPLRDPLAAELIAVQSKGMERWLAFELSSRLGVLANAELPFPRHLVSQLVDAVLGDEARAEPLSEHALTFAIASVLSLRLQEPSFAPLARYLAADRDHSLLIQLSTRLAQAFDDYAVYRPELLLAFERGEHAGFEAELVRALVQRFGAFHQAARVQRLVAALAHGSLDRERLPERICVFGVASLPPLYLDTLSALARHVETHLFVLTPCREYFGDVRRGTAPVGTDGHPLLASLGRLGRELQDLLEERTGYVERERADELFGEPGRACLLHALQSDMLELVDRGAPGGAERLPIASDDGSIAIHACHGPMREVQVLHDQLLALLEPGDLEPHQIVVMTPDIERYAPMIEAVFGAGTGKRIPFSVADRKPRSSFEVVHALSMLFDALSSRFHASTLLDLLAVPCIGERAGISPQELDDVRALVEQGGARLAVDAEHRGELGLPRTALHTWRFALDRLLLGLALEGRSERLYVGMSPAEAGHGSEGELVGKLVAFCERLFAARARVSVAQRVEGWSATFAWMLSELVASTPVRASEHLLVQGAVAAMVRDAEIADFDAELPLASVWALLEDRLEVRMPARGLLARGVTFCQLVPMRSIPFEVVCLLGLNDGDLPRQSVPLAFERAAEHGKPRPGDRSARDDDRHMVLEAILCARRRLLVSYVGFGIDDNRPRPPSVVVAELIDAIDRGFFPVDSKALGPGPQQRKRLVDRLCVKHKLHAWSPRYFDREDARLFSFSRDACDAARALATRTLADEAEVELVAPEVELLELDVDELVRGVTRPLVTFAERRLGLYLRDDPEPPKDREPFDLVGLERWKVGDALLDMRLRGVSPEASRAAVVAQGMLPHGSIGDEEVKALLECVEALVGRTLAARGGERLAPLLVSIPCAGLELRGTLHGLFPKALVVSSFSKAGRRMELECFVRHVVLSAQLTANGKSCSVQSVIVCPGKGDESVTVALEPLVDPAAALEELIALYRLALQRPLPFEHNVSRAYAEARYEQKEEGACLKAARSELTDLRKWGMGPHLERFYPSFEALVAPRTHDFATLAGRTFLPLLACRRTS